MPGERLQEFLFLAIVQPAQNPAFRIMRHIVVEDKDQLFVTDLQEEIQVFRQPLQQVVSK